jgi:hypothetical protein
MAPPKQGPCTDSNSYKMPLLLFATCHLSCAAGHSSKFFTVLNARQSGAGALNIKLPEGCIIPPKDVLYVAASVAQMRRRTTHPMPLTGHFIVGDATVDTSQQLVQRIIDTAGTVRVDAARDPF